MTKTLNEFLTAEEVAPILRTSKFQIYEWARNGTFPDDVVLRIGRKLLINFENLKLWIEAGGNRQSEVSKDEK